MADFDPRKTPGSFSAAPAHAYEVSDHAVPGDIVTVGPDGVRRSALATAAAHEKTLAPLTFPPPRPVVAAGPTPVPASASKLRIPGQPKPSVHIPAHTAPAPAIVLTDAPELPPAVVTSPESSPAPATPPSVVAPAHVDIPKIERPAVDAATAAHLASPLAEAARRLAAQRQLTHQPAASNSDSPSRGMPAPSADPGKQITGGFGDAGDAQYYPLDGSELRELVRGLMSVIDAQIENDLRFSMAITYPRVSAKVSVEILAYAAGGDGGQYDPSFVIEKVMPPHDKTPVEIARQRADQVCFVIIADRVEMTPDGQSVAPPNQIRQELGLTVPRKQAIQTPQGRLLVDLPA